MQRLTSGFILSSLLATGALCGQGCDAFGSKQQPPRPTEIVPTDDRAPASNAEAPVITGGSMLALSDGTTAVVGDGDRHRILVVDLEAGQVRHEVTLPEHALVGRVVESPDARVFVVLRGVAQVAELDPVGGELVARHAVCAEPRGLAYDSNASSLRLACSGGELWTLTLDGEVLGKQFVAPDLRDVVVADDGLMASTFRDASVYMLDSDGVQKSRVQAPSSEQFTFTAQRTQRARAAWRMTQAGTGKAVVVHQRAVEEEIDIDPHEDGDDGGDGFEDDPFFEQPVGGSPYGGGGAPDVFAEGPPPGCESIVTTAVTMLESTGGVSTTGIIAGAVLPVDVAVSDDRQHFAIASAGLPDQDAPVREFVMPEFSESFAFPEPDPGFGFEREPGSLHLISPFALSVESFGECDTGIVVPIPEPAVSVAFVPRTDNVLVQTREPAKLYVVSASSQTILEEIELGGRSVADTGHDLFHRDSGGGIACASCHMEGAEDGHTWVFSTIGKRRTQPLNVGLRGTQPFHWDGTLVDIGPLMEEVFVGRMGGVSQSRARMQALSEWLFELEPMAPVRSTDDPAALRGKELFESAAVGCASCHSGAKFTNNESFDVGTSNGLPLQVPSLRGVSHRLPVMHDGCAGTLRERFTEQCGGGDKHGVTSTLSAQELDDLVAYLETL